MQETESPGIICIVCHQVIWHVSGHGTSSIGKHLLVSVHIGKLNELRESELSKFTNTTIDDTALAIVKRQGSHGISFVRSQNKRICNTLCIFILTSLTDTIL
jgi:hypothetical protein